MKRVKVKTQAEFDAAIKNGNIAVCVSGAFVGRGTANVEASGLAHVKASGLAHIVASGLAHVEAYGLAHVVASGMATVVASGMVTIEASGDVVIRVFSCQSIHAGPHVLIMDYGNNKAKITGGKTINAF